MKLNKCTAVCAAVLSALSLCSISAAAEDLDLQQPCSLRVTLTQPDESAAPIADSEVVLYYVANLSVDNVEVSFEYTGDFADYGKDAAILLTDKSMPQKLFDYAAEKKFTPMTAVTNAKGVALFENLDAGIYLGGQREEASKGTLLMPFLVSLPTSEGTDYVYDIDATPKIEIIRLTDVMVEKIWNDDGKHRPQSIQVQLLKQDAVTDTVTLSAENEWKYTWKNLTYDETYNVVEIVPEGYTESYQRNGMQFTITNTEKLIQTGQLDWPIPVLAFIGILLVILGEALCISGKKQKR